MAKMNWSMANKRARMAKYGSMDIRDCFLHTSPPITTKKGDAHGKCIPSLPGTKLLSHDRKPNA